MVVVDKGRKVVVEMEDGGIGEDQQPQLQRQQQKRQLSPLLSPPKLR